MIEGARGCAKLRKGGGRGMGGGQGGGGKKTLCQQKAADADQARELKMGAREGGEELLWQLCSCTIFVILSF